MQYRTEIDGLRAIAVLPVIFFHSGLFGFTGGYVGVDIFFVISGYLITSIIQEDINNNRFSLIHFYERRARRILPALSIVLIFCTIMAFILMPANHLKSYSQSLISVATFSSNFFFYLTSGYFATVSDEKPLLHTWSLAVEEQYYIFFPILMTVFWSVGKKKLALFILSLSVSSLLLSHNLLFRQAVAANFYLIFSRAWELFAGSLIAIIGIQYFSRNKFAKEVFGAIGLILIIYSVFFFNKQTPFQHIYSLVPVFGTFLIIVYSDQATIIGQLLSNRLFVGIGLISYSLYLWHQPLFAFMRLKTIGEPGANMFLKAIVLTFIISYVSYRYIERPFRNNKSISQKSIFRFSIASVLCFVMLGVSGHLLNGIKGRFKANAYLKTVHYSPKRTECHTVGENFLPPDHACRYFEKDVTWACFGDSHIVELAYALSKILEQKDKGVLHLSFSGCPPALLFEAKRPGCSKWIEEALIYLENDDSIEKILLGFRHSYYLFGGQLDDYPNVPQVEATEIFSDSFRKNFTGDARELYWKSFSEIVRRLLQSGKKVYILYPIPELPTHISIASAPFSIFGVKTMLDLVKSTHANYYLTRHAFILSKLDTFQYRDHLQAIKPFEILCDSSYCPAAIHNTLLYFDDSHLSIEGSKLLLAGSVIGKELKINKDD